ncbi:MAG: hypothetical protein IT363_15765 [Methanoregulaceae archaeon]|nr:hypothetical protein [Methanoregulaceae archaeon]
MSFLICEGLLLEVAWPWVRLRVVDSRVSIKGRYETDEYYSIEDLLIAMSEARSMPDEWKLSQSEPVATDRRFMMACHVFGRNWNAYVHPVNKRDEGILVDLILATGGSRRYVVDQDVSGPAIRAAFAFLKKTDARMRVAQ